MAGRAAVRGRAQGGGGGVAGCGDAGQSTGRAGGGTGQGSAGGGQQDGRTQAQGGREAGGAAIPNQPGTFSPVISRSNGPMIAPWTRSRPAGRPDPRPGARPAPGSAGRPRERRPAAAGAALGHLPQRLRQVRVVMMMMMMTTCVRAEPAPTFWPRCGRRATQCAARAGGEAAGGGRGRAREKRARRALVNLCPGVLGVSVEV
eukprot:SAG22_NODE_9_length_35992_cov_37.278104_3_plen_203_part_00